MANTGRAMFKTELNEITTGSKKIKKKKNTKEILQNLYNSRQNIIDLLNNNSRIKSEAIYEANRKATGTRLKILTPRQMLQRLPIALAQVKTGKNSNCLFFVSIKTSH